MTGKATSLVLSHGGQLATVPTWWLEPLAEILNLLQLSFSSQPSCRQPGYSRYHDGYSCRHGKRRSFHANWPGRPYTLANLDPITNSAWSIVPSNCLLLLCSLQIQHWVDHILSAKYQLFGQLPIIPDCAYRDEQTSCIYRTHNVQY